MKIIPDFVGLLVLVLFAYVGYLAVPDQQVPAPMWVFIFFLFAAVGLYMWRNPESPRTPSGWLALTASSILGAGFCLLADMLIGHFAHPEMPTFTAATHVGSMFGFVFTLLVCPCITIICLAGTVRSVSAGVAAAHAAAAKPGALELAAPKMRRPPIN